jgi:hypothetical protein
MSILLPFILYPSRKPISLDFVTEFISFLFCFVLGLGVVRAPCTDEGIVYHFSKRTVIVYLFSIKNKSAGMRCGSEV